MLDLTQNEDAPLERETVDLELVAHAAAEAIAPLAKAKQLDLAVEMAGTAGTVVGDSRRLRQVIEHLLRHAIAGTPRRAACCSISTATRGSHGSSSRTTARA
ncbi:MAG: hypothetical protein WDN44_04605 [Sphingomonas sp.]